MKEEFYQKQMLEVEKQKVKALVDLRDVGLAINMSLLGIATVHLDIDKADKALAVNKAIDTLNSVLKDIDTRWSENE